MTEPTSKPDASRTESVAFQYRREQLAREMQPVYQAFGFDPSWITEVSRPTKQTVRSEDPQAS